MTSLPQSIDDATRAFLETLGEDSNPPIFAFIQGRATEGDALQQALLGFPLEILGELDGVFAVRARAKDLPLLAARPQVSSIEGWPAFVTQRGADIRDLRALTGQSGMGDQRVAVFVRLVSQPNATATELMSLVGLEFFPGQSGLVRGGSLPVHAVHDALAIPDLEAIKVCTSMLPAVDGGNREAPSVIPDRGKIGAATRMAIQEGTGNPEVAVFVEFGSQPTPEEQAQMEAAGLRIVSGQGPIKTGRVPLQNIAALSALQCIRAIEAESPLYPDSKHEPPDQDDSYDVKP